MLEHKAVHIGIAIVCGLLLSRSLLTGNTCQIDQLKEKQTLQLRIDINTADAAELAMLPKIGPQTAVKILEARQVLGKFSDITELSHVPGVGPATLSRIGPLIGIR